MGLQWSESGFRPPHTRTHERNWASQTDAKIELKTHTHTPCCVRQYIFLANIIKGASSRLAFAETGPQGIDSSTPGRAVRTASSATAATAAVMGVGAPDMGSVRTRTKGAPGAARPTRWRAEPWGPRLPPRKAVPSGALPESFRTRKCAARNWGPRGPARPQGAPAPDHSRAKRGGLGSREMALSRANSAASKASNLTGLLINTNCIGLHKPCQICSADTAPYARGKGVCTTVPPALLDGWLGAGPSHVGLRSRALQGWLADLHADPEPLRTSNSRMREFRCRDSALASLRRS